MRTDELLNIIDLANFYQKRSKSDGGLMHNVLSFCEKTLKAQEVPRH